MNSRVRRRVSAAHKALDFLLAHPATDPGYTAVVALLEQTVLRVDALAYEGRASTDSEHLAVQRRAVLRQYLMQRLRHLVRVGKVVARVRPELRGVFTLPRRGISNQDFLIATKVQSDHAAEHEVILKQYALGETFIVKLREAISAFELAGHTANLNRLGHVGANADLRAGSRESRELINALDGFNRERFGDDQKELAAWDAAKSVFGPYRPRNAINSTDSPIDISPSPASITANPSAHASELKTHEPWLPVKLTNGSSPGAPPVIVTLTY
jgi:hypothetical protein